MENRKKKDWAGDIAKLVLSDRTIMLEEKGTFVDASSLRESISNLVRQ